MAKKPKPNINKKQPKDKPPKSVSKGPVRERVQALYICPVCDDTETVNSVSLDTPHFRKPSCNNCDRVMCLKEWG